MSKQYAILNYGCQMNESDAEHYAGQLQELGYTPVADFHVADVILVNTCCVRESAEKKIAGKIGELKAVKAANPNVVICVAGCMAQKDGEKYYGVSVYNRWTNGKTGILADVGYLWNIGDRDTESIVSFGGASDTIGFDVVDRGQYFVKAALTAKHKQISCELGYRYSKGKSVRDNKWNFNANFIF